MVKNACTVVGAVLLGLSVAGCVHVHSEHSAHVTLWRYQFPPPPPPAPPVQELVITLKGTEAGFPQYWERNTLLVDLQGVGGTGRVLMRPRDGKAWPARLALMVTPGAVGVLEVYADQRSILPITPDGKAVELELDPGLYSAKTEQIAVSWRPATP
jgi:hypothetical protein